MKELLQRAKELEPELLENRRWLHRHPELGFELKETCTFVEEKLKAMGYAPQRMSKAGIVATVGKTGGKDYPPESRHGCAAHEGGIGP